MVSNTSATYHSSGKSERFLGNRSRVSVNCYLVIKLIGIELDIKVIKAIIVMVAML